MIGDGDPQGLNRYSYTDNNPVNFSDPSGHCTQASYKTKIVSDDECDRKRGEPDVTLTDKGDKGKCSRGNCDGRRMYELYLYYLTHSGFWNNHNVTNGFTAQQFLAFMLMAESGGDKGFLAGIEQAAGVQLGSGIIDAKGIVQQAAYCPTSTCNNGIFNFLATYSQSSWGRYNDMISGDIVNLEQAPVNYDPASGAAQLNSVAATMTALSSIRYSRTNDLPTDWGTYSPNTRDQSTNDPALAFMGNVLNPDQVSGTTNVCSIYYVGGGNSENPARDVVYTRNQAFNWGIGYCH